MVTMDAMVRPTFSANTEQQRTLRALAALAARMAESDARLTALIEQAKEQGIPIEHIARHGGVTPKTVYRRLGRPMR